MRLGKSLQSVCVCVCVCVCGLCRERGSYEIHYLRAGAGRPVSSPLRQHSPTLDAEGGEEGG